MKRVWEGAGSLRLLEVTSVRGGVVCNQGRYNNYGCWPLSTSKIKVAIIAQSLNIWRTGSFFAHPDSCTLCIVPQDMCKAVCHRAGPSLPLGVEGLQLTPEFQNSYETDSASAIVVSVGTQIPNASYSTVFPEFFLNHVIFTLYYVNVVCNIN